MKKLFTLAAVLVAAMTMNAETIYSWEGSVGTTTIVSKEARTGKSLAYVVAGTSKYNADATEIKVLSFKSSYSGTLKNAANNGDSIYNGEKEKTVNYVEIAPVSGGFKAGDVLKVKAFYNNASAKEAKVEVRDGGDDVLYTSELVVNGKTEAGDMTLCTYTLEADQAVLRIGRNGKTTLCVGSIIVERGGATAIDNTEANVKATKVVENGQLFIIKNGVKYSTTGTVVK